MGRKTILILAGPPGSFNRSSGPFMVPANLSPVVSGAPITAKAYVRPYGLSFLHSHGCLRPQGSVAMWLFSSHPTLWFLGPTSRLLCRHRRGVNTPAQVQSPLKRAEKPSSSAFRQLPRPEHQAELASDDILVHLQMKMDIARANCRVARC